MTARRAIAVTALLAVAAALAAGVWWTSGSIPRPHPLEASWEAVVLTIAGDGIAGVRDDDAAVARFSDPFGVAIAGDGTIYVSDAGDAQRIRRLSLGGVVSTLAGGERGFSDGAGAAARFNTPSGIALDPAGNLFVADTGNNAIRRIAPDGTVSTVAGDGTTGYRDGPGAQARFNGPVGVAVDGRGRIVVADTYNDRVRAIEPDGTVVTLAGPAALNTPSGVAVGAGGTIYVADTGDGAIRTIAPDGSLATFGSLAFDVPRHPVGIAVDRAGSST